MNKRVLKIFLGGATLMLIGAGCAGATTDRKGAVVPEMSERKDAPSFSLPDYNGKTVLLEDFKGQPVVLNSWAAWCPFCKQELIDFAKAQEEFKGQVAFVAIDRAEPLAVARGFTDERGITNDLIYLLDPKDSFYRSIGGFSMPETLFVDSNGRVVFHQRGPLNLEQIRIKTNELLEADGL